MIHQPQSSILVLSTQFQTEQALVLVSQGLLEDGLMEMLIVVATIVVVVVAG